MQQAESAKHPAPPSRKKNGAALPPEAPPALPEVHHTLPEVHHKTDAPVRPQKRIAIFGTTPSRMEGPHQDDSGWERWTIGPGGKDHHNWERLFEVHGKWPADFREYLDNLSQVKPPRQIVTIPQPGNPAESWHGAIRRWKEEHGLGEEAITGDWSAAVRYPREHILAKYGRRMWFSSSIAWCIALAIEEGATDIGLWGIDLESGEEYISQFAGCAHFLDLARLIGITVHLPAHCMLLRDPAPYPDRYETHFALATEQKLKWLRHNLGILEPQYEGLKMEVHRLEGQILLLRQLTEHNGKIPEIEAALTERQNRLGQVTANMNQLRGEIGATEHWRRMFIYGMADPQQTT